MVVASNTLADLSEFSKQLEDRIDLIISLGREKNLAVMFSISTTMKANQYPYLVPIRTLGDSIISGVVVYSRTQALITCKAIEHKIQRVLVDCESKQPMEDAVEPAILKHFGIAPLASPLPNSIPELVRFFSTTFKTTLYKPNDLTVESVWSFISQKVRTLKGKKIAIVGCGNIGFKLALKFAESGAIVNFQRRSDEHGTNFQTTLRAISKSDDVYYFSSPADAARDCDVLIGAAPGVPIIDLAIIKNLAPGAFIMDIGKGCVTAEGLNVAIKSGVFITRGDIYPSLHGFSETSKKTVEMIDHGVGRKKITQDYGIVSGGALGLEGDIIVDNFSNPAFVYGVCDGKGDMKVKLSETDHSRIAELKQTFRVI